MRFTIGKRVIASMNVPKWYIGDEMVRLEATTSRRQLSLSCWGSYR